MSSSQPPSGLAFSIAADLQACRLLELPPDLLDHLSTCPHPTLAFKANHATDTEAFLTTSDKTWLIRQVHTSNTVYVTTPSPHARGATAISQCASALECLPAPAHHAENILHSLLVPFHEPQHLHTRLSDPHSKEYVFAHTPMSHQECQTIWKDRLAFEHSGQSFRPTSAVLVRVWKWLLEIAYANGLDLAKPSIQKDSIDKMLDGEDEWPRSLVDAIFSKLSEGDKDSLSLQQQSTVKWIGGNILQAHSHDHPKVPYMNTPTFLDVWQNALPESWRSQATTDALQARLLAGDREAQLTLRQGLCKLTGDGKRIEFAGNPESQAGEGTTGASEPAATAAAGKRKWHEKFAAARKQGKPS